MDDDPLFDPWTTGEASEAAEEVPEDEQAQEAPRWKSPAGSRGVPASRPVPGRRSPSPPAETPEPVEEPSPPTPEVEPPEAAEAAESIRPTPAVYRPQPPVSPSSVSHPPAAPAEPLRDTVLSRLEWLSSVLATAGHETVLDDRLASATPALRFRFAPRPGPFEDSAPVPGAVLEVTSDPDIPLHTVARLWLDPLSATPSEELRVADAKLNEAWVDALLLDFVGKALAERS